MKRFIDEFSVSDPDLMRDIVHALENCPASEHSYSVELHICDDFDINRNKPTGRERFHMKIFKQEVV